MLRLSDARRLRITAPALPRCKAASPKLGEWLAQAPFGLAMSSGFFSFFAHTGILSALVDRGLLPAHVAGSSAGALVGGAYGAGLSPSDLADVLARLERAQFWDPSVGAGLLAGKKFDRMLREMLPVAAFEATRVPVRISAFDIYARKTAVLARGDLSDAIRTRSPHSQPGYRPVPTASRRRASPAFRADACCSITSRRVRGGSPGWAAAPRRLVAITAAASAAKLDAGRRASARAKRRCALAPIVGDAVIVRA
jgi:hypothetical protein